MSEFYKMEPLAWDRGTDNLTLEQEAAYLRICNAIYAADQAIRENYRVLAGMWRCNERKAKRLLSELVEAGKIQIEDGFIFSPSEIVEWQERNYKNEPRPAIPLLIRRMVKERDGEVCFYCGATEGPFHLDHIIPWSRGGEHTTENLTVSCASCNWSKGDKTVDEWRSMQ